MNVVFKMIVLLMVFIVTSGVIVSAPAAATLLALQVGMEGPEFILNNLNGETKAFPDLKGEKLTVLVFWSTWSKKSETVLARMQKLYAAYKAQGLAIVGINADEQRISASTLADIRSLKDKLKIDYPMLVDNGLVAFHDYGVIALPTTIVVDGERLIKHELSGYPLVGAEMLVDFIVASVEGKKPELAVGKERYQPDRTALRLFNMGMNMLKSKRMADKAENCFIKAVEADPGFILPHLSLGKIYGGRGDTVKAQAEFRSVLVREPNNPIALCESGILLINDGKSGEGLALFDTARKAEESYAPCYYYAGYAYGKEGKLEIAWKMFDEAEKTNPSDYHIFVYKGKIYEQQKDLRKAAEAFRIALEKILP